MEYTKSKLEYIAEDAAAAARRNKNVLLPAMLFSAAAYMFVFTNKLLNLDEIAGLFGKGETFSSGRWALYLTSFIFPDYSMPWINGLLCVAMLSISAALIVSLLGIKDPVYQALFAGLFVTFPSQIITFSYMFTCAPYALAVLMAVLSVYFTIRNGKGGYIAGVILLCLSLGIYQAYITLSASLYVVYFIREVLAGDKDVKSILKNGGRCIVSMLLSLALYFVINRLVMRFAVTEYNSYASAAMNTDLKSMLKGLRVAFTAFFGYFYKGYYHLAPTELSMLAHITAVIIAAAALAVRFFRDKGKNPAMKVLLPVLLAVFPISVNCIYIISSQRHTLMLLGFTAVYALIMIIAEAAGTKKVRAALGVCLALMLACNIFWSNSIYLKMKLEYEQAYGFYSTLISRVKSTEGYDADTMLIITGDADEKNLLSRTDEIDTSDIVGLMEGLINIYSRYDFIKYYIGYDYNPIDWDGWAALDAQDEVARMPVYPYDGSVKKIGDYMVIKLG